MDSCMWWRATESWVWWRDVYDGELLRAGCDREMCMMVSYWELSVMESWVCWRATESWVWWRAGYDGELLGAGCDGELGVMESWVWWRATKSWGVMERWVWWWVTESWVSLRAGCDGELLGAGCDAGLLKCTPKLTLEFLFSSPPLWCRFIILDYQRDTALPRRLHTPANGPIRVLLVLVSTGTKAGCIFKCQLVYEMMVLCWPDY